MSVWRSLHTCYVPISASRRPCFTEYFPPWSFDLALETGSMGGAAASPHKSMTFNSTSNVGLKEKLRELEERKLEAEKAVKEAEAAAGNKDNKTVAAAA
ncbi:hypothetical protein VNI00_015489 [Paramarasmius palmivorus]|uniref:Uncharacterized protein n=1 Tax=Paramarasmius palmivorus TaxID=297713 RepID=A0AAW0BJM9_9AGAR